MPAPSAQTWILFAVILTTALAPCPSLAVEDGRPSRLGPIVIVPSSEAPDGAAAEPGAAVSVVPARASWRGYRGLPEILRHTTGVHIHHLGGREDMATMVVRGAAASRVKILLDGIALTRADRNTVNLADIPIDNVERIEIYKGFIPSAFAAGGAESAVNIITRTDDAGPRAAFSFGSFGTQRLYAGTGGTLAGGHLSTGLGLRNSDGNFRYTDDNGTEAFAGDDRRRDRENNDYRSLDLRAAWRRDAADGSRLSVTENFFHKDEGLPGLGSNESSVARLRMTRNIASLAWESAGGERRAQLGMTLRRERLSDPKNATSGITGIGLPYELETGTTMAADASTHWRRSGGGHLLDLGLAAAFERFRSRYPGSTTSGSGAQQRLRSSVVMSDELHVAALDLDLTAQLRHETLWNRFDGQALLPTVTGNDMPSSRARSTDARIGVHWQAGPQLALRADLATYFRPPSFAELFGNDGFSVANPQLGPETGTTHHVGMVAELYRSRLEWSYFDNDTDDMILFVQTGARVAKPLNIGRARSRGHEFDLRLGLSREIGLALAYTQQRSTNLSPFPDYRGKDLPGRSEQQLHATITLERPGWDAAWTSSHRGAFYLDQANNPVRRVPGHWTHGARIGLGRAGSGLRIDLELDNLGDEQYADEYGFPVPGRALYVTLSVGPSPRS